MDPHHPESEVPPPVPSRVDYCTTCGGRIEDGLGLGNLCVSCDSAWRDEETADTEPAPPLDGSDRQTIPPGDDPMDDPAHQLLLRRLEEGLDRRFSAMQAAVTERLEDMATAMRTQSQVMQRWADNGAAAVTRLEQLAERVERRDHYCATQHGNGASLPPDK